MRNTETTDVALTLTRDHVAAGESARSLGRAVQSGSMTRLRRGVYADAPSTRSLDPRARYLLAIRAVALTRKKRSVFGYESAAAIWGCERWARWPSVVHLMVGPAETQNHSETVCSHRCLREPDIVEVEGTLVTTYARTLVDLARIGPRLQSVVALDEALNPQRRRGRPVVTRSDLLDELSRGSTSRGRARARSVIEFANGGAANGGESYSRLLIHQLGFAAPDLQIRHPNPRGGNYFTDFEWSDRRLVGEFDGHSKYLKPEYLGTMTPGEAVVAEKIREDHLRAEGFGFVRWSVPELREPARLRSLLLAAGVPRAQR